MAPRLNVSDDLIQAARVLDIDPHRVSILQVQLGELMQNGQPVDITVTGISCLFARTGSWEELGVPQSAERSRVYKRGTRAFFPSSFYTPLQSAEAAVRRNLLQHSHDVTWFNGFRFVPRSAFATWKTKHDDLVTRGYVAKERLVRHYDVLVDWAREQAFETAVEAYDAIRAADRAIAIDRSTFINRIVSGIMDQMPSVEHLRSAIQFKERIGILMDPATIEQNLLHAAQFKLQREQVEAETATERAMREAQIASLRDQIQERLPFQEVLEQLYDRIEGDVQSLLHSIQTNGYFPGQSVKRAQSLIEFHKLMSITPNDDLDSAIHHLELELQNQGRRGKTYNHEAIKSALLEIGTTISESVRSASTPMGRFGAIEFRD